MPSQIDQWLAHATRIPGTPGGGPTGEYYFKGPDPANPMGPTDGSVIGNQQPNDKSWNRRNYYNHYKVERVPAKLKKETSDPQRTGKTKVVEEPKGVCHQYYEMEIVEYETPFYLVTQRIADYTILEDLKYYYDKTTGAEVGTVTGAAGLVPGGIGIHEAAQAAGGYRVVLGRIVKGVVHVVVRTGSVLSGALSTAAGGTGAVATATATTTAVSGTAAAAGTAVTGIGAAGVASALLFGWGVFELTTNFMVWTGLGPDAERKEHEGWRNVYADDPYESYAREHLRGGSVGSALAAIDPLKQQGGLYGDKVEVNRYTRWDRGPVVPCPTGTGTTGGTTGTTGGGFKMPPFWIWILVLALLLALIIGVVVMGGGGDDDDGDLEATPTTEVTGTTAEDVVETTAATAPPPVGEAPTVGPMLVTFDQSTYTTTYQLAVDDPDGDPVTVTWTLEPHEDCGVFESSGATATWTHPHESQRPLVPGFPEDRFCRDTTQQQSGHPGTITATVTDGSFECTLVYTGGSEEGTADGPGECVPR